MCMSPIRRLKHSPEATDMEAVSYTHLDVYKRQTAYWAYDVTLMRQMAYATGRKEDEAKYAAVFEKIRAAFVKTYVRDDGFVAGADNSPSPFGQINNPNAKSHGGDTQTGYCLLYTSRCV